MSMILNFQKRIPQFKIVIIRKEKQSYTLSRCCQRRSSKKPPRWSTTLYNSLLRSPMFHLSTTVSSTKNHRIDDAINYQIFTMVNRAINCAIYFLRFKSNQKVFNDFWFLFLRVTRGFREVDGQSGKSKGALERRDLKKRPAKRASQRLNSKVYISLSIEKVRRAVKQLNC